MLLPVIMAGGTGSRLWPMSRELYPKQFLRLYGQNSMLQETISRLSGLEMHEPMVICNEEHRFWWLNSCASSTSCPTTLF